MCKHSNVLSLIVLISLSIILIFFRRLNFLIFPSDYIVQAPPVPIPNTAVNLELANGSRTIGPARVGCC